MRLPSLTRVVVALCFAASVGGCASYSGSSLKPGIATADEVRQIMGAPRNVYREPDGTEIWEYPRGPMGFHTYMAHLDKNGVLKSIEQVLGEHSLTLLGIDKITREDVLRRIGSPWRTGFFERRKEEFWDYRFRDLWGYPSGLHVIFNEAGIVTQAMILREHEPGESSSQ